jgi:hypothetical protein
MEGTEEYLWVGLVMEDLDASLLKKAHPSGNQPICTASLPISTIIIIIIIILDWLVLWGEIYADGGTLSASKISSIGHKKPDNIITPKIENTPSRVVIPISNEKPRGGQSCTR